jgi:hypothetical protein
MTLINCSITSDELGLITKTRNKDCKQDIHLKMSNGKPLPNGRQYVYCRNCLWAELAVIKDLSIGKITFTPGTTL